MDPYGQAGAIPGETKTYNEFDDEPPLLEGKTAHNESLASNMSGFFYF